LQSEKPALQDAKVQMPAAQPATPLAGFAHTVPHALQLFGSVRIEASHPFETCASQSANPASQAPI
jgi:hypothetical protein